ncbi:MAG: phospholipid carrier-dependent glycosyltransferase [Anaerolineae bacterium]
MTKTELNSNAGPSKAQASRAARVAMLGLLTVYGALSLLYSVSIPIFEASDELWHYPMVDYIARTWQLPVQPLEPGTSSGPWRQEGSQPPLYYALGAALITGIDTEDLAEVRQPNPHAKAGEITPDRDNVNLVIHNWDRERFPWRGTVLAVHIVRILSVALGVWSVYLTWALIRELFPAAEWLALAGAAIHAFTPMHLFISSSINNDNLIIPLSTLALLLMVRRVRTAGRVRPIVSDQAIARWSLGIRLRDVRPSLVLGSILGLALLTKASGIALLALAAATLAWETWRRPDQEDWGRRVKYLLLHLVALLAPVVAISGWWFYRNFRLYGDWLGLNAFYAVLGTRDVPASLQQLWAERQAFLAGYWGNFGGLNVPMPDWVYAVLNGTAVIAAIGVLFSFGLWLLRGSVERTSTANAREPVLHRIWPFAWNGLTAARALAWAWPAAVIVSWSRWATITWSSQGRLIFSALPMWSLALAIGLARWVPRRQRAHSALAPGLLAALLLTLCVVALPAWILPAYQPPEELATPSEALPHTPIEARFGDTLELRGYALTEDATQPGKALELELVWHAISPTLSHHSLFIHILGAGDRIVAQRDTFPGHGLLPTTQLRSGRTWVERHILPIPATAYAPDDLVVALGVYETATGTRLATAGPDIVATGDTVRFGKVRLEPRPGDEGANTVNVQFGDGMLLTSYDVSDLVLDPGDRLTVDLTWQCTAPMVEDYTVSIQLIDDRWRKVGQSDEWPQAGQAPTSAWRMGDQIMERRVLTVAGDAESGAYDLRIAVYRVTPEGELAHLPVSLDQAAMPAKALALTRLRVR